VLRYDNSQERPAEIANALIRPGRKHKDPPDDGEPAVSEMIARTWKTWCLRKVP